MFDAFIQFISDHQLADKKQRLLLAVSGGIDSMSMLHLFQKSGFNFALAHCNFQLRGRESDDDQKFVETTAQQLNKKCFVRKFNTEQFAVENNISIQMAARDLRYSWFDELAINNDFDKIVIAHNRDDVVETFLINLIRGTGIKGLTGIKPHQNKIIRPLLFASRNDIIHYANEQNIAYREDSSNKEVKYQRNLLRHKIIPLIAQINPSFQDTVIEECNIFQAVEELYSKELLRLKNKIIHTERNQIHFDISQMQLHKINSYLLFEWLKEFGFLYPVVVDIYQSFNSQSGKLFFSDSHQLIKDRNTLIIERRTEPSNEEIVIIEKDSSKITFPINLSIRFIKKTDDFKIPKTPECQAIDYEKVKYPLILRHWKEGDYFIPLGMKGKKKLSDFFNDKKISRLDKQQIWLLTSGNDIIWILGYHIDDRYKISNTTKNILLFSLNE